MVTIPVVPRRERKKAATRERIIAAAIGLFSSRGIESPTVDDIAAAADVGKGTVYNYFQSKEDIVVAFMAALERRVQAKSAHFAGASGSAASILTSFLEFQFRLKQPYHRFVRVFLAQMYGHTEAFRPWIGELQTVIDPPLLALFKSLQERRKIRNDVRAEELVLIFKTIHLGLAGLWAIEGPPWRGTKVVLRKEIKLFCEGLEAENQ